MHSLTLHQNAKIYRRTPTRTSYVRFINLAVYPKARVPTLSSCSTFGSEASLLNAH